MSEINCYAIDRAALALAFGGGCDFEGRVYLKHGEASIVLEKCEGSCCGVPNTPHTRVTFRGRDTVYARLRVAMVVSRYARELASAPARDVVVAPATRSSAGIGAAAPRCAGARGTIGLRGLLGASSRRRIRRSLRSRSGA